MATRPLATWQVVFQGVVFVLALSAGMYSITQADWINVTLMAILLIAPIVTFAVFARQRRAGGSQPGD